MRATARWIGWWGSLLLLLPVLLSCPTVGSAQAPGPSVSVQSVDSAAYPQITATVSVLDAGGVPVGGLGASHFHALDGDVPVEVSAVAAAQDGTVPLCVVLVIDTSGSMQGDALGQAKQAAAAFVSALQPNDQTALIAFSDGVRSVAPFTDDRGQVTAAIAGLQADGSTVLYEAVQASVLNAVRCDARRRAIVLMTDGQNDTDTSDATRDGSLGAAANAAVPFFTIGFGEEPDVEYLQALSAGTKGTYSPANTANITDVYAGIARLLRGQYVLTLRDPQPADGASGTLRIAADVAGTTTEAQVSFVRGDAAPVLPPTPTAEAPAVATGTSSNGTGARTLVIAIAAALLAVVAIAGTLVLFIRARRRPQQLPAGQQTDEPLPAPPPSAGPAPEDHSRGQIILLDAEGQPRSYAFGVTPLRIGSGPECEARLERDPEVAPQHALVWAREGKIMLRHVGGPRRRTLVNAKPVDWVILDDGDEFAIGPNRFRAESLPSVPSA